MHQTILYSATHLQHLATTYTNINHSLPRPIISFLLVTISMASSTSTDMLKWHFLWYSTSKEADADKNNNFAICSAFDSRASSKSASLLHRTTPSINTPKLFVGMPMPRSVESVGTKSTWLILSTSKFIHSSTIGGGRWEEISGGQCNFHLDTLRVIWADSGYLQTFWYKNESRTCFSIAGSAMISHLIHAMVTKENEQGGCGVGKIVDLNPWINPRNNFIHLSLLRRH